MKRPSQLFLEAYTPVIAWLFVFIIPICLGAAIYRSYPNWLPFIAITLGLFAFGFLFITADWIHRAVRWILRR